MCWIHHHFNRQEWPPNRNSSSVDSTTRAPIAASASGGPELAAAVSGGSDPPLEHVVPSEGMRSEASAPATSLPVGPPHSQVLEIEDSISPELAEFTAELHKEFGKVTGESGTESVGDQSLVSPGSSRSSSTPMRPLVPMPSLKRSFFSEEGPPRDSKNIMLSVVRYIGVNIQHQNRSSNWGRL